MKGLIKNLKNSASTILAVIQGCRKKKGIIYQVMLFYRFQTNLQNYLKELKISNK